MPQRLARFNRHVTNPIHRLWAGRLPPFGILEHIGLRSGRQYRTPLSVFPADLDGKPGVVILLTYGPNRDRLKNLHAAGGGQMERNGETFGVSQPQTVTRAQAAQHLSGLRRPIFARLPFEQTVLLTKTG